MLNLIKKEKIDIRLKLALAWSLVIITPQLNWFFGISLAVLAFIMTLVNIQKKLQYRKILKTGLGFYFFWVVLRFLFNVYSFDVPWPIIYKFALHLFIYLNIGFSLYFSSTPLSLGGAVSFYLKPFLGRKKAKRLGLAIVLVPYSAMLLFDSALRIKNTLIQRAETLSFFQKVTFYLGALINCWERQINNIVISIISRYPLE